MNKIIKNLKKNNGETMNQEEQKEILRQAENKAILDSVEEQVRSIIIKHDYNNMEN